jgi:hypothetical protein
MGLLCELFVAKRGDALKFEKQLETAAPPRYERGDAKGLLPISFEVLWAVMERKPFNPHVHTLPDLYFWSHARGGLGRLRQRLALWKAMGLTLLGQDLGNTWLHEFPPSLVKRLASITDDEARQIAKDWSSTEDMSKHGAEVATDAVNTLRALAGKAEASGRGLYVWGSV